MCKAFRRSYFQCFWAARSGPLGSIPGIKKTVSRPYGLFVIPSTFCILPCISLSFAKNKTKAALIGLSLRSFDPVATNDTLWYPREFLPNPNSDKIGISYKLPSASSTGSSIPRDSLGLFSIQPRYVMREPPTTCSTGQEDLGLVEHGHGHSDVHLQNSSALESQPRPTIINPAGGAKIVDLCH